MSIAENTQELRSHPRRYDFDRLRVLAVLLLIYFHAAAVFYQGELGEFYIRNAQSSPAMNTFILFVYQWHMPLFFLISGAGTWFALSHRSAKQYVQERGQRLFIPFVFGTLVLVPPQVYLRLLSHSTYDRSYWQFYPEFFNGVRPYGNFEWGHLWFLIYLFTFSILALPLLISLRNLDAQLRSTLANWVEKPGVILLMALPFAAIEGSLRPHWLGFQNLYDDWANVCLYLLYFIYGYLIFSDNRFGVAIDKHLGIATALAIVAMTAFLGLWQTDLVPDRAYSVNYVLYQCFRGCNSWFWVLMIVGLGRKFLNVNSRLLSYANEAAYPVYLLHQTVLVTIAFYVVRWNVGVMTKFWTISTATLVVTIALYELLIRRVNLVRFLFGLKPLLGQSSQSSVTTAPDSSQT
jgi:glucan biosynthesis protein C